MIKIEVENPAQIELDYHTSVITNIISRINVLRSSISHLTGNPINTNDDNFTSVKAITRKIINLAENQQYPISRYNKPIYIASINTYLATPNNLATVNLVDIDHFLEYLTANNNSHLIRLLTCKPELLSIINAQLLATYNIADELNQSILKLAFDYGYVEISNDIKRFFRTKNFAAYCPYCNLTETQFRATIGGAAATTHELDHFFDKASSPLLSYSLYNLIPSDATCNGINKKGISFTNQYHLNPYINGFSNSMSFKPIIVDSKISVTRIEIEINVPNTSPIYNQLIGTEDSINEDAHHGNINVFKLLTKYSDRTERAKKVLRKVQKTNNGIPSIRKYLHIVEKLNAKNTYINWYIENIETPFHYNKFNSSSFSKFNRDLHDYYYRTAPTFKNRYIRELIEENLV